MTRRKFWHSAQSLPANVQKSPKFSYVPSNPSKIIRDHSSVMCCITCAVKVKVKVTLRLTVSQSISLDVEPHLGLRTRYLLLFDSYGLVFVGRLLYMCCWPLLAHSFLGPSPLELATIFYCLRFETSLFVASYDSQGHGGSIRPRLNTGEPNTNMHNRRGVVK
jgi:hypothetical protein